MDRGRHYLSFDVSYHIIGSILREIRTESAQHPQPQLSILKPIFHCDAKQLTLGLRVGSAPQHKNLPWRYQYVSI